MIFTKLLQVSFQQNVKCKADPSKFIANLTSVGYVTPFDNETALATAIKNIGPIAVAIYASDNLSAYSSGIFYDIECTKGYDINHAVVAVGYGRKNGIDYYLLRNSWDTDWGENGYFRIARNRQNHCLVATYGQYPIV